MRISTDSIKDALIYLDRFELDNVQVLARRYCFVVTNLMATVCLRQIRAVGLKSVPSAELQRIEYDAFASLDTDSVMSRGAMNAKPLLQFHSADFDQVLGWLLNAVRSSVILNEWRITRVPITTCFLSHAIDVGTTIRIHGILVVTPDLTDVEPTTLHGVLLELASYIKAIRILAPSGVRAAHVTDDFIKKCVEKGVSELYLPVNMPEDQPNFNVSEEGMLYFCFGNQNHCEHSYRQLEVARATISPQFFQRLSEANRESTSNNSLVVKTDNVDVKKQVTGSEQKKTTTVYGDEIYAFDAPVKFCIILRTVSNQMELRRGDDIVQKLDQDLIERRHISRAMMVAF